jgi:hypothetical protein
MFVSIWGEGGRHDIMRKTRTELGFILEKTIIILILRMPT